MEKSLILGECKWQPRPVERSVLADLVAKTDQVVPSQGLWRVYYLGFGHEGWTEAAQTFACELITVNTGQTNW